MARIADRCPHCGAAAIVYRTDTVPAMPGEEVKGLALHSIRYQSVRCPACGRKANKLTFISRTQWHEEIVI